MNQRADEELARDFRQVMDSLSSCQSRVTRRVHELAQQKTDAVVAEAQGRIDRALAMLDVHGNQADWVAMQMGAILRGEI